MAKEKNVKLILSISFFVMSAFESCKEKTKTVAFKLLKIDNVIMTVKVCMEKGVSERV